MLSYPIPEAETLLDQKLKTAQQSLANCEEDQDFLREQITVRRHTNRRAAAHVAWWWRRRLFVAMAVALG